MRRPDRSPAELAAGLRLLAALPAFLRGSTDPRAARRELARRLAEREAGFLLVARRAIYANPASPYRQLLKLAGCEAGDLERLVGREGLEGALAQLAGQGVYLTVEELKGRRTVVRGSTRLSFAPVQFRNPLTGGHLTARSSGSRGSRVPVAVDLAQLRVQAGNHLLVMLARGGQDWPQAQWSVPGSSVMGRMLTYARLGARQARWFSPVDPAEPGLHARYRWGARFMRLGGLLAGRSLPAPEHVPLDDPTPIARWLAEVRRAGATPQLWSFPSAAVRVCQVAESTGFEIAGSQLAVFGEPFTQARLAAFSRAGVKAWPFFGSSETGVLGYGCLRPVAPDDFHQVSDLHAVIQPGPGVDLSGLPGEALLLTSLRLTARTILVNVSLGDQADLDRASCGCPLADLGWSTRLQRVRSFEKLNVGGIALVDSSVIQVLEETLPAQFGGGPTDYQLVESESEQGGPDLLLLAAPRLGPLDERALVEVFLRSIGEGSGVEHLIELQWRQAGLPRVERSAPRGTPGGKIQHLHQERSRVASR